MHGSVQVRHRCAGKVVIWPNGLCPISQQVLAQRSGRQADQVLITTRTVVIPRGMDESRLIFYTSKEAAHCLYDP